MTKLDELAKRKKVLKEYLMTKFEQEDWHGVSDCANDLRELHVEISVTLQYEAKAKWVLKSYNDDYNECGAV